MNNKGQSTAHHWGWMIVLLVIFFTCAWIYSANRPNEFEKGSTQIVENKHYWPLSINIGEGGCASLGAEKKRENKDAITNKVSH